MRSLILCIASYCLIGSVFSFAGHGGTACVSCHAASRGGEGCAVCHPAENRIFAHAMTTRAGERAFVDRTYSKLDSGFWEKNCSSCHVQSCRDCHLAGKETTKPAIAVCQRCHKGYYTGWDYSGRAPREDNMRYQRGIAVEGETFLKMLPDVHYLKGMSCGDCHSMKSLAAGKKTGKICVDCHKINRRILEHSIPAHLEKMECYACHSAWGAQEYGTFYLRFRDLKLKEDFDLKPLSSLDYLKSAYLKRQDAPPLGINSSGRVSPIRPMYISYYTDIMAARNNGPENVFLAAEWRAWFPHTVQLGTVGCEGCHDNPGRFILEPQSKRIYNPEKDGMTLESFWVQQNQRVVNGSFMSRDRYAKMSNAGATYKKGQVKKWQQLLRRVEGS